MIRNNLPNSGCQIQSLPGMARSMSRLEQWQQVPGRLKRILKRRLNYLIRRFSKKSQSSTDREASAGSATFFEIGDEVRIRPKAEIQASLDLWNRTKGCVFMEEMWQFCGTEQRVLKRVEKFLDERDYLIKKTHGVYILRDVMCQGTNDFGPCDRSCFFFWREEWLEKSRSIG